MITEFKKEDLEAYLKMADEFYHSEAVLHSIPKEYFEKTFNVIINNSPYAKGFILKHDNQNAGFALISLTYSNEAGGMVVLFEEIFICEEFRGKGLAKEFFNYIFDNFNKDVSRFRLEISHENINVAKLYEKLGFKEFNYYQMYKDL